MSQSTRRGPAGAVWMLAALIVSIAGPALAGDAAEPARRISAQRIALKDGDSVEREVFLAENGRSISKRLVLGSTGESVSIVELQRREQAAWEAEHGKLSPRLVAALESRAAAADATMIEVSIWIPSPPPPAKPSRFDTADDAQSWRREMRTERIRVLQERKKGLARAVAEVGGRQVGATDGMPIVEAELPVAALADLTARPEVLRVDLPRTEADAGPLHTAMWFWDADDDEALESFSWQGLHGSGINVGVYENANYCGIWRQSSTVPAGFSDLGGYTLSNGLAAVNGCDQPGISDGDACPVYCNNGQGYCRGGRCMKEHVTMVASKLGSVRDGEARHASQMNLFFANVGNRADRMNWLASQGVTIVNDSETSVNDVPVNWSIRNDYISLTKSVGNSQSVPVDCFDNGICVGSYSIVSTANIDAWKTDPTNSQGRYQLSGSTAFIDNPSRYDAEKPDVMGDGEASLQSPMITPRSGEWAGAYGTSFAAPSVGGQIALLQEYFPTARNWPELVRPMVMVSAIDHNLLGASLSRNGGPDEIDGAGIVTSSALKQIVDDGTWRTLTLTPSSFDSSGQYVPTNPQIVLQPGETVRVVLGWMYCAEGGVNSLSSDFDLYLRDQTDQSLVDWSVSDTNSLEMLQFTNDDTQGHVYEPVIQRQYQGACGSTTSEYAGLAWTIRSSYLGPSREFPVTKTADTADDVCDGDCSLREAITLANAYPGHDRIVLDSLSYPLTRAGALENNNYTGDLDVKDDLTIVGKGRLSTTISGSNLDRIFHVLNGARLTLQGMSLTFGSPPGPGGAVAAENASVEAFDVLAIFNSATDGGAFWGQGGDVRIVQSLLENNTASGYGGAVFFHGSLFDLLSSEVTANTATNGGGLYNESGMASLYGTTLWNNHATAGKGGAMRNFGVADVYDSTVTGNDAALEGGGIWNGAGDTMWLVNSTLADNTAPNGTAVWSQGFVVAYESLFGGTCSGGGVTHDGSLGNMESPGHGCGFDPGINFVDVPSFKLGELSYYGGPTQTRPPIPGSPAIDPWLDSSTYTEPYDQRGIYRPVDGDMNGSSYYDPGAVERVYVKLSATTKSAIDWDLDAVATSYRVYRGSLADLVDADANGRPDFGYGQCVNSSDPDTTDKTFPEPTSPAPGSGWFYLVEPVFDGIGGTGLGWSSDGLKRNPAATCL